MKASDIKALALAGTPVAFQHGKYWNKEKAYILNPNQIKRGYLSHNWKNSDNSGNVYTIPGVEEQVIVGTGAYAGWDKGLWLLGTVQGSTVKYRLAASRQILSSWDDHIAQRAAAEKAREDAKAEAERAKAERVESRAKKEEYLLFYGITLDSLGVSEYSAKVWRAGESYSSSTEQTVAVALKVVKAMRRYARATEQQYGVAV